MLTLVFPCWYSKARHPNHNKGKPKNVAPEDAIRKFPQKATAELQPFEEMILEANDVFLGPGVQRPVDPSPQGVVLGFLDADGKAKQAAFEHEAGKRLQQKMKGERTEWMRQRARFQHEGSNFSYEGNNFSYEH